MKRASRDEQNVVGLYDSVLGADRRAFDDRQQVPLYTLARDVRPADATVGPDLVDLIEENDSRLLGTLDGIALNLVVVDRSEVTC